jgi:hypothetical protein
MRLFDRLWQRRRSNGDAARRARAEAERKLCAARRDWPVVHQAHDQLAAWIDSALRGTR